MQRNEDTPSRPLATLPFDEIIRHSTLYDPNPDAQLKAIIAQFNQGNKEDFSVESVLFGTRIDVNEVRLIHRNNVPQLLPYTYYPRRLGIYLTGDTDDIGVYNQTDLCIGAHGRYLVNVPQGALVKAWEGNKPVFLGEGPHVIRHANFKLDKAPVVNINESIISHGNYHILRIPRDKVAKIWLGSTPYLLESRAEPYVINDPTFKIVSQTNGKDISYFHDAASKLIEHGSIKRILPQTGEVAIAYDNGILKTLAASDKPFLVDSPTYLVDGFLKTNRQTLLFPSEETQEERRRKNPKDLDAIAYETFRTSDGLPIGVNLLVAYEIDNPQTVLEKLSKNEIKMHIENIVVAHMLSVIQSCSSADFQMTGKNAVNDGKDKDKCDDIFQVPGNATPFFKQLRKDTKQLANDLQKIGIKLTQLRIEPPKILDPKIANEMAQNSLLNAGARAKASVQDLEYEITRRQALRLAEEQRIQMDREKQNKIIQSQAEAESIQIRAKAELDAAEMRAKATQVIYDAEIANKVKANDTEISNLAQRAKLFDAHPGLKEIEMARIQAKALKGINSSVISPEVVSNWFSATPASLGFFGGGNRNKLPSPQNDGLPMPLAKMTGK